MRATQPYSLGVGGGGVRFVQAQDQQVTTRQSDIVTECLIIRSVLMTDDQELMLHLT